MEAFFIELIRSKMSIADEEVGEISDEKINEICHYLNENYKERIRLSELCFLFGTNKTTLCKRFKAVCVFLEKEVSTSPRYLQLWGFHQFIISAEYSSSMKSNLPSII